MLFVIFLADVDLNIFNYDNIPGKGLLLLLEKKKYTDVTFLVEGHELSMDTASRMYMLFAFTLIPSLADLPSA